MISRQGQVSTLRPELKRLQFIQGTTSMSLGKNVVTTDDLKSDGPGPDHQMHPAGRAEHCLLGDYVTHSTLPTSTPVSSLLPTLHQQTTRGANN